MGTPRRAWRTRCGPSLRMCAEQSERQLAAGSGCPDGCVLPADQGTVESAARAGEPIKQLIEEELSFADRTVVWRLEMNKSAVQRIYPLMG